jgi:hypothetical protein
MDVNTKKLCENCMILLEGAVTLKRLQTVSEFKCENCGRRAAIGKKCEITVKKGAGAK